MNKLVALVICLSAIAMLSAAGMFLFRIPYFHSIGLHMGMLSVAMFFVYEKNTQTTLKRLGITHVDYGRLFGYAVLGMAVMASVVLALGIILSGLGMNDSGKVHEIVANKLPPYLIVFAILFAPITEELFFRAFLADRFGVVLSSAAFAGMHLAYGSIAEILAAFCIGLVLAYIYKASKSVLPAIAMHFAFNLSSISLIQVLR